MGIDNFTIKLDNPNTEYYSPGSTVSGSVLLTITGEERTYAIRIKLGGIAETSYVVYISDSQSTIYSSKRKLIRNSLLLFGDDKTLIQIPVGEYSFTFTFQLPATPLPPSYRITSECHVWYGLQASIGMPWYRITIQSEVTPIRVVTPFDLNHSPWAKLPSSCTNEKRFGLFWFLKDPLRLTATINPSGYCLGQVVPVEVEIDNGSDRELKDVIVQLIRVWTLNAEDFRDHFGASWEVSEVVSIVQRNERVPVTSVAGWNARLMIPSNMLPTLDDIASDIIKIRYVLRITACVDSMFSWNLAVDIPVTIGNIPFT